MTEALYTTKQLYPGRDFWPIIKEGNYFSHLPSLSTGEWAFFWGSLLVSWLTGPTRLTRKGRGDGILCSSLWSRDRAQIPFYFLNRRKSLSLNGSQQSSNTFIYLYGILNAKKGRLWLFPFCCYQEDGRCGLKQTVREQSIFTLMASKSANPCNILLYQKSSP